MEEQYKQIPQFPKYEASNLGNIRNMKTKRVLKPAKTNTGYMQVCLRNDGKNKMQTVHRLVLLAWKPIQNPDKYDVNHIDWDKTNNTVANLNWMTRSENILHGGSKTELRILQSMVTNEIKLLINQWFEEIADLTVTKEVFTKEILHNALVLSINKYKNM